MQKPMYARIQTMAFAAALLIAGCSSEQPKPTSSSAPAEAKKKPAETEQRLAGREAFQKLYLAARNWSPDSRPIAIESRVRKGEKADGTAAIWSGMFASASKQSMRSYLWSGAVGEEAPEQGISPGGMSSYSPSNSSTQVWDTAYLKIDTDEVLKVANKHGGAAILKKTPDMPVKYALEWDTSKQRLQWVVAYGTSTHDTKLAVVVNAATGEFVKVQK